MLNFSDLNCYHLVAGVINEKKNIIVVDNKDKNYLYKEVLERELVKLFKNNFCKNIPKRYIPVLVGKTEFYFDQRQLIWFSYCYDNNNIIFKIEDKLSLLRKMD